MRNRLIPQQSPLDLVDLTLGMQDGIHLPG